MIHFSHLFAHLLNTNTYKEFQILIRFLNNLKLVRSDQQTHTIHGVFKT